MTADNTAPKQRTVPVGDLLALLLVVAGCAGLAVCAWLWHPLVGGAVLSVEVLAAGVVLGLDR